MRLGIHYTGVGNGGEEDDSLARTGRRKEGNNPFQIGESAFANAPTVLKEYERALSAVSSNALKRRSAKEGKAIPVGKRGQDGQVRR